MKINRIDRKKKKKKKENLRKNHLITTFFYVEGGNKTICNIFLILNLISNLYIFFFLQI